MLLRTVFSLRAFLLLVLPVIAFGSVAQTNECDTKAKEIQQQIDYAKQHGNTRRAAGLETALKEVKNNCTVESLKAERQEKIKEKQRKVTERKQELKEAQQKGDTDKIAKQQKKLTQAQAELKQAQAQK
ncbi:DUF1090 domain-containing protein [Yersinia alsatica]|uniref:DUF1090 domain-containing protein n=1 Tax=Yersinia alsatica TaxID=2890317 RepID=A0ABY5US72_9GAMM|nr:DUF1090 domain-containing protein [Yersinia alsatica]OWF69795.1 hypothetical protein B4901_05510 [Yersinia frederiksenii]UWM46327.1 DUF1090 domain-containing protein [Yersinia alsatica]CNK46976.1 periplasmic protein YqjC [Yersinia frederiksenii]CNL27014.1 periplasmic protein YqjC [Yersinia frederiksenii]